MKSKTKYLVWGVLLCTFVVLFITYMSGTKNNDYLIAGIDEIRNKNVNNPAFDSKLLKEAKKEYNNDEVVGILAIENTGYIVPVVQAEDNAYYLNHDPYKNKNGLGSIYLDYRLDIESSPKLLIYGHNSSNMDMPFKILENFYDKNYYESHKYMTLITESSVRKYEIFSVYVETSDFTYMNIKFDTKDDYYNQLKKLKNRSIYDTGVKIEEDDEVLILQTCSTHSDYKNYDKKYLLVILRRV